MIQYPNIRPPRLSRSYAEYSSNYHHDAHSRYIGRYIDEDTTENSIISEGNIRVNSNCIKLRPALFASRYASKMRRRLWDNQIRRMSNTTYNRGPIYRYYKYDIVYKCNIPYNRIGMYSHYDMKSPIHHSAMKDIMDNSTVNTFDTRHYENAWARGR